jgi:tetratricopeptide (TPR) repeat protein
MKERYVLYALFLLVAAALVTASVFVFYPDSNQLITRLLEPRDRADRYQKIYQQLSIAPLPFTVANQPVIQSKLEKLAREPCYRNAISELSDALLDAGFPRESAAVLISFADRCPGSDHLLAGAYNALMAVSDAAGAVKIAEKLVGRFPAQSTYRYWRARAYDDLGDYQHALGDYLNTVQLVGDLKNVSGDAFYNISRMYSALGKLTFHLTL